MRILILHSKPVFPLPSGEAEVAKFENLCLSKYGKKVEFIEFGREKPFKNNGLSMFHAFLHLMWSFKSSRFVEEKIRDFKPDIVHFHGLFPYLSASALQAAHKSGAAVVQTLHNVRWLCLEGGYHRNGTYCDKCNSMGAFTGVKNGCKRGKFVSFLNFVANFLAIRHGNLFKWVDGFIAVSNFIKDQHLLAGFPPNKIFVKKNGLDLSLVHQKQHKQKRNSIVFIGRISKSKGSEVIKFVIENIHEPILLVGDGPDLENLKDYCTKNNYSHVNFLGRQSRKKCFEILGLSKCVIIPSQCGEAFSLVAAEALALGVPIVGSNVGGLGELIL